MMHLFYFDFNQSVRHLQCSIFMFLIVYILCSKYVYSRNIYTRFPSQSFVIEIEFWGKRRFSEGSHKAKNRKKYVSLLSHAEKY